LQPQESSGAGNKPAPTTAYKAMLHFFATKKREEHKGNPVIPNLVWNPGLFIFLN